MYRCRMDFQSQNSNSALTLVSCAVQSAFEANCWMTLLISEVCRRFLCVPARFAVWCMCVFRSGSLYWTIAHAKLNNKSEFICGMERFMRTLRCECLSRGIQPDHDISTIDEWFQKHLLRCRQSVLCAWPTPGVSIGPDQSYYPGKECYKSVLGRKEIISSIRPRGR